MLTRRRKEKGGVVSLLNQLGKLPTYNLFYVMPEDGFEPITNEIFNQVHYQLCYFGDSQLRGGGYGSFTWLTSTTRVFGDSQNRTGVILMQTERNTIILCPLVMSCLVEEQYLYTYTNTRDNNYKSYIRVRRYYHTKAMIEPIREEL